MYVLTIVNDPEAQYETKVFKDDIDIPQALAEVTGTIMNAIQNICGYPTDELCAKYVDQTLEGRYPEYEHQLTDIPVEELYADYFSMIRQAPRKILVTITAWVLAETHKLTQVANVDENIFMEWGDDVGSMLFGARIYCELSTEGRVYYEVLFEALPDKDTTRGKRIHVKLEHKDTFDTLD